MTKFLIGLSIVAAILVAIMLTGSRKREATSGRAPTVAKPAEGAAQPSVGPSGAHVSQARSSAIASVTTKPELPTTPRLPLSFAELPDTPEVKARLQRFDDRGPQFVPQTNYVLKMYSELSACMREYGVVPVDGRVDYTLHFRIDPDDALKASLSEASVDASTLLPSDTRVFTDCFEKVNRDKTVTLARPLNAGAWTTPDAVVFPIEGNYIYAIFRDNGMWPYPRKIVMPRETASQ